MGVLVFVHMQWYICVSVRVEAGRCCCAHVAGLCCPYAARASLLPCIRTLAMHPVPMHCPCTHAPPMRPCTLATGHAPMQVLIVSDEHPNVVRCFAMEEDREFVYLALERCKASLADVLQAPQVRKHVVQASNGGMGQGLT